MEEHERAAYLTLKPAYGGYEVTLDQALTKIQEAGIVFGINYGTVRSIFSDKGVWMHPSFSQRAKNLYTVLTQRLSIPSLWNLIYSPRNLSTIEWTIKNCR